MRIVAVSDTHLQHSFKIPPGDILVHAGDLTFRGDIPEMNKAIVWLKSQPHRYKIIICGNHDWLGEKDPSLTKSLFREAGLIYLDHESTTVEGITFFGSAYTPEFCNWAFNLSREGMELHDKWERIPEGIDVLITHGPPKNILDETAGHHEMHFDREQYSPPENVGCYDLAQRLKIVKPALHVFGHIHHSYGIKEQNGTIFVNAAICNEQYKPLNKPVVINFENRKVKVVQ